MSTSNLKMFKKRNILIQITFIAISICLVQLTSCKEEIKIVDTITLKTQAEVNSLTQTTGIKTMTIEGVDINDLSTLKFVTVQNLVIKNTGITKLILPNLASISTSFVVEGNTLLDSISSLPNLKIMGGTIDIKNNPKLVDIRGLLNLTQIKGAVTISGNTIFGEDKPNRPSIYGLNVVKSLVDVGVLSASAVTLANNHPKAATDVTKIGQMGNGGVLDYTISSLDAANAFIPEKDTVNNLTIKSQDINDDVKILIASKIKVVLGTITIENTLITNTEGFFDVVKCNGGIHLKDNPVLMNPNGLKGYKEINGDLIIEGCPQFTFWRADALMNLAKVSGSLKVTSGFTSQSMFQSLKYVGGDFDIENGGNNSNYLLWDFLGMDLTYIGGNLILKNNQYLYKFVGLSNLTNIGGNIVITGNGSAIDGQMDPDMGWKIIKQFRDNKIVKGSITVDANGKPVDLDLY